MPHHVIGQDSEKGKSAKGESLFSSSRLAGEESADAYLRFVALGDKQYCYSFIGGMLVHCRVSPSLKDVDRHLYTGVENGTVRVKWLAHEHNTVTTTSALIQTY